MRTQANREPELPFHVRDLLDTNMVVTIPETAKATKLSRSAVYRLLASGELDGLKVGGRRLVTTESIRRLLTAGKSA
jgi:excisionase family DNA binding protein